MRRATGRPSRQFGKERFGKRRSMVAELVKCGNSGHILKVEWKGFAD